MPSNRLSKAAVLGAGTMGAQIALAFAMGGVPVSLWGRRPEALRDASERISRDWGFLVSEDLANREDEGAVFKRLKFESGLESAVEGAGFVIEAISEDIESKRRLLRRAQLASDENALLSSTTSAIRAGDLQAELGNSELFCIAHFAQPAHIVSLVEVVPGDRTSESAAAATSELLESIGKVPVECPDIPGFLWARIQHAVLREFASLVGKGLATPEACDKILKLGYAARLPAMGAFEHADLAGLKLLNGDAAKAVWADLSNVSDPAETPVGQLFERGFEGMSSGRGFYDWNARDPEEFKKERDREIVRRMKILSGAEVRLKNR